MCGVFNDLDKINLSLKLGFSNRNKPFIFVMIQDFNCLDNNKNNIFKVYKIYDVYILIKSIYLVFVYLSL